MCPIFLSHLCNITKQKWQLNVKVTDNEDVQWAVPFILQTDSSNVCESCVLLLYMCVKVACCYCTYVWKLRAVTVHVCESCVLLLYMCVKVACCYCTYVWKLRAVTVHMCESCVLLLYICVKVACCYCTCVWKLRAVTVHVCESCVLLLYMCVKVACCYCTYVFWNITWTVCQYRRVVQWLHTDGGQTP